MNPASPLLVLTVLCLSVAAAEFLVRRTFLRHLGTALVVILLVAVLANLGVIPSASGGSVVYVGIFRYLAPLSIFYLLLDVNLASIRRAGAPLLFLFLLGSAGTALGVVAGMWLVDGPTHFGEFYPAISGMFTGTYSGGGANFNAIALHYDMMREGVLFAGMTAVDNIITALWMIVTLALPLALRRGRGMQGTVPEPVPNHDNVERETEAVSVLSLGVVVSLGLGTLVVAEWLAERSAEAGLAIPSILILTTLALLLAQLPAVHWLAGGQVIGLFCVYLFLAVIGAFCELAALGQIGELAWRLLLLVTTIVVVHGSLVFGVAALAGMDMDVAAIASQANIGGSSSALALAKSLSRMDLYLPGILVGALGNGLGTYLGFLVASLV